MLNYTTTTIVNSEGTYSVKTLKGTDKKFVVNFGPELYKDSFRTPKLVGEKAYTAAVKAKATITLPTDDGVKRIAMYIRLRNNNNPYFSNDWTFKGKPLYIEFNGGATPAEVASLAKKYMLAQYGYNLVNISVSGASAAVLYTADDVLPEGKQVGDVKTPAVAGNLIIEAHDQWEMFMDQDNNAGVVVEKLVTVDMAGNVITSGTTANSPTHEEFVKDSTATVVIANGNEAFGDFAHIVKDLRLPTGANLRWQGIAAGDVFGDEPNDDKPLPTGKYTQYTVQYDSERGVGQQTVLGGVGTSRTVHVFYVESAVASDFKTKLLQVATNCLESGAGLI